MDIQIRKAKPADVGEIINLNQQLFDYESLNFDKTLDCSWPSKNEEYFKKSIEDKNSFVLVAETNNKIIGYFIGNLKKAGDYRNIKRIAEGDNAYILPDYQRKGIGIQFYKRFLKWAKEKEITKVKAVVSAKNKNSLNWHKKLGFEYYDIVLEKEL